MILLILYERERERMCVCEKERENMHTCVYVCVYARMVREKLTPRPRPRYIIKLESNKSGTRRVTTRFLD